MAENEVGGSENLYIMRGSMIIMLSKIGIYRGW